MDRRPAVFVFSFKASAGVTRAMAFLLKGWHGCALLILGRDVVEGLTNVGGAGGGCSPLPDPDFIVGENDIYKRKSWFWGFGVFGFGFQTPPPPCALCLVPTPPPPPFSLSLSLF